MEIFIFFFAVILLYLLIENCINQACLRTFRAVIHVNGIRGKTSTCRYIDAGLRARYRVFTKTTGTDAMMIHTDGSETPVKRLGPANIHEQIRMIRQARKEGAEILILECMAVNPELQKIAQERIVKSDITVITNVRYDHIFEMGDTLEEIAASLSVTIPENGTLYTADPQAAKLYQSICERKHCRLELCPPEGTAAENIGIAAAVCRDLGVGEEEFKEGIRRVHFDFGTQKLYPMKNRAGEEFSFLCLFSANDPLSTKNNVEAERRNHRELYFLYNHREDRPDRALLFARHFFPHYKDCTVFISGRGASLPKRLFSKDGPARIVTVKDTGFLADIPASSLVVGVGNIKGMGYRLIKALDEGSFTYE